MFDARLRRLIDPALDRAGEALAARGVHADHVTLAGLAFGLAAAGLIAVGAFGVALIFLVANRLCDGLDGAVAKVRGRTDAGGFLDISCDFIFYGAVPIAFAIVDPAANALAAAALLFSFYINGSAFLAYAILAARRPDLADTGAKSFRYLWGLAEGAETIAFFIAMVLWPAWFSTLAFVFAGLCIASAIGRVVFTYRLAVHVPPSPSEPGSGAGHPPS